MQERAFPAHDLAFKVELEVLPEIALPDFAAVALTRLKAEVTDEAVAKALGNLADRNRTWSTLRPRNWASAVRRRAKC